MKIIVFATYYQSLLVAIPGTGMDELGGSERWNDFILCIEMALFAVMHMRVFSFSEFLPDGQIMARFASNEEGAPINVRTDTSWPRVWERARDVLTISDVLEDAYRNLSVTYGAYMMQGIEGGILSEGDAERISREQVRGWDRGWRGSSGDGGLVLHGCFLG